MKKNNFKNKSFYPWTVAVFVLALALGFKVNAITTITTPVNTEFGTYTPLAMPYKAAVMPYKIPDNLQGVINVEDYTFSDSAISHLVKNGFVAIQTTANLFSDVYSNSKTPAFVSTDIALHSFHTFFDHALKIAEYQQFYAQLNLMLKGMMADILPLRALATNDSLKLAISRAAALLDVAGTLLTDTMTFGNDNAIRTMVVAETSLVYQHIGFVNSKVMPDFIEDYSQYVPRGHYTIDPKLEHYFRAMMYLGRMTMRSRTQSPDPRIARIETMQALVLCRLLSMSKIGTTEIAALWSDIYEPTSFLVGQSDDCNFKQYITQINSVVGPQTVAGDINGYYTKLNSIISCLNLLPKPQILSGLSNDPGLRIMGQRFVPDSYIFSNLVYKSVGTLTQPRLFPRGLDVLAVLGSSRARQHLIQLYHDDAYLNYTSQLDSLTKQFSSYPSVTWAKNLYWNWMYTLVPLLDTVKVGFPSFMTTTAWADKTLTTSSGSWVELRHDTMLYAKQSYTVTVGINCGPKPVAVSQGYVEPNPDVFGRLSSLAMYTKDGLTKFGLSTILPIDKLTSLSTICTRLQTIAIKELQQDDITLSDYAVIADAYKTFAGIEDFSRFPVPPVTDNSKSADSTIAVIADVHTDPNTSQVLEVGIGKPMQIFVIVPIEGKLQLCVGAMYSYYEFIQLMTDRLTDEQWRVMVKNKNALSMPVWVSDFTADKDSISGYWGGNIPNGTAVFGLDSIPSQCKAGDSVIAIIQSSGVPSVFVNANGYDLGFTGAKSDTNCSGNCLYRIAIPPAALADTSVLTITSWLHTISPGPCVSQDPQEVYRKVIVRKGLSRVGNRTQLSEHSATPQIRGNRIIVPQGTTWRIVDMLGRQIARIGVLENELIMGPRYASMPLFLVPYGNNRGKPLRFIISK